MTEITREDAERILAPYGLEVSAVKDGLVSYSWPLSEKHRHFGALPLAVLRDLDPDRPPSLAALRRLTRGVMKVNDEDRSLLLLDDVIEESPRLIAQAWELGRDD